MASALHKHGSSLTRYESRCPIFAFVNSTKLKQEQEILTLHKLRIMHRVHILGLAKVQMPVESTCRTFARIIVIIWPFTIPTGMLLIRYWRRKHTAPWPLTILYSGHLKVWASKAVSSVGGFFSQLSVPFSQSRFRYATAEEETDYWRSSERYRLDLGPSDANSTPPTVPLVKYYVPRLLPEYRTRIERDAEATEYQLPARVFCKWHRMVFRGPLHPSLKQARKLVKNYSVRDQQEIYRMTRLLTDEEVFMRTVPWTPKYRDMWRRWLDTKGADMAIVFE
ncbi:hypothetical protein AcV5_003670 [Taiwanofungus camphoratus]|nr:hypothetical protein AcV5_003670 [Antrodia cinnamomea]